MADAERDRLRPAGVVAEFFSGMGTLARGFAFWRRRPGAMWLGLIPAAIVGALLLGLLILLGIAFEPITAFLTPFANEWDPAWRGAVRLLVGIALLIALLGLSSRVYTAVALYVGTPFYSRIWAAAEAEHGGLAEDRSPGFWRSTVDTWVLILQAVLAGVVLSLIGLIPVAGTVVATVLGFYLSGRALANELTMTPLAARGLDRAGRRAVLKTRRARSLGFGVAVQLCYLVPLGAVLTMPAAVAGGTLLARHILEVTRTRPAEAA